jgi:hypothetical protein
MKWLSALIIFTGFIAGGVFLDLKHPELKMQLADSFSKESLHTLECRFSASQIMDAQRKILLKSDEHRFLEPEMKFHPYLMMDVKYTAQNQLTGEGIILWDMVDGEMVINAKNWEKTHGFGDCINSGIDKQEFKIINMIAQKGGIIDRDTLNKSLQVENTILDAWIENCRKKMVVVQSGNGYRLHIEKPRLFVIPQTKLEESLVTKTIYHAKKLTRRFSEAQIRRIAYAAFGQDFVIRSYKKVFLPICSIIVENPDGSLHTSYWNTLNGQQLPQYPFYD